MYDDLSLLLCLALPNDSQSRLLLPHMHIEEMLFLTVLIVSAAFLQQGFVPLHLCTCMYILHLHLIQVLAKLSSAHYLQHSHREFKCVNVYFSS